MAATATYSGGYAEKNPDKAKECGSKDGHHDGMFVICQEICDEDNCGKHAGGVFDKCQEHNCLQCIVKEGANTAARLPFATASAKNAASRVLFMSTARAAVPNIS